ncbi:isochorismate synthase [Halorhodospira halophila]|uniref:isochorismate synthase n=1 Tax=Halorhodospira halophila TaxID=1053 RepID=UPI001FD268A2|nr:isochorismate synthase [Halorhodospira halophila]
MPSTPPSGNAGHHRGKPRGPAEQAIEDLLAQVRQWQFNNPGLLRASVSFPEMDPLVWLETNPLASRSYWQDRAGTIRLAGIGTAWQYTADSPDDHPTLLRRAQALAKHPGVHLLCAFSFDGQAGAGEWQGFPASLALLPALELQGTSAGQQLSANLYAESASELQHRQDELIALLEGLRPTTEAEHRPSRVIERDEDLDFAECSSRIRAILHDIEQGHVHKAVLARQVALRLDRPLAAFNALRRWSAITDGSYCFAIEHAGRIFMGCSPERLFFRSGRSVQTESLAGTVRRGETEAEDAALEASLREDSKLVREHAWVTRYIRGELEPWAIRIDAPEHASVLKLDRIQHRRLPIQATLRPGVGDHQLLDALHPTPAVCGFPRRRAQDLIRRQEGFHRGWYSGVIGLLSGDASELAVAIRSALVAGDQAWCYSGVGIVRGSEPEAEWQELEAKIESFLSAVQG